MRNGGAPGWSAKAAAIAAARAPLSGRPWPAMPPAFVALAAQAGRRAGYAAFAPDACLINR